MDYLAGKTAVITGVSKGIGKAVALDLLARGVTVVGWGRTAPDFQDANLHFVNCDVSAPEAAEGPGLWLWTIAAGCGRWTSAKMMRPEMPTRPSTEATVSKPASAIFTKILVIGPPHR